MRRTNEANHNAPYHQGDDKRGFNPSQKRAEQTRSRQADDFYTRDTRILRFSSFHWFPEFDPFLFPSISFGSFVSVMGSAPVLRSGQAVSSPSPLVRGRRKGSINQSVGRSVDRLWEKGRERG